MDGDEVIFLPTPHSPKFTFVGHTLPEEVGAARVKIGRSSEHQAHNSPVKRQRAVGTGRSRKRKVPPAATQDGSDERSGGMDGGVIGVPESNRDAITELYDGGEIEDPEVEDPDLRARLNGDGEYEVYVESALADVAGFIQLHNSLFVVQGWNKQRGMSDSVSNYYILLPFSRSS